MKKKIIFSFLIVFINLIAFELIIRIGFIFYGLDLKAYQKNPLRYDSSAFLGFKGRENWELNHKNLEEHHNDKGYKSDDFNIKKDSSRTRIIILGGSSVYGYLLNNNETISFELQNQLNEYQSGYEIINLGVPGYNTYHSISQTITVLLDYKPDMVILYQSWNDIKYFHQLSDSKLIVETISGSMIYDDKYFMVDKSYLLTFLRAIINKYYFGLNSREKISKDLLRPDNEINFYGLKNYERNLDILSNILNSQNIKLLISSQLTPYDESAIKLQKPLLSYGNYDYYKKAFNKCRNAQKLISNRKKNTYYCNPNTEIKPDINIMYDHIHLKPNGTKKLASFFKKVIINRLNM